MAYIKGYKFSTEDEAKNAVKACNDYYGYPKTNTDDITIQWCEYYQEQDFYVINYNDTLNAILGNPVDVEIIIPEKL